MKKSKLYDGAINKDTMDPLAAKAYTSFLMQRQRCYNKRNNRYQYYGARGIEVEYGAREFIGWYLEEIQKYPGIRHPACGRKDHGQNYRLDNIELVERAENTREMTARTGGRTKNHVKVVAETRDGIRLHFDSIGECARVVGIKRELLHEHLAGKIKSPIPQLRFRTL